MLRSAASPLTWLARRPGTARVALRAPIAVRNVNITATAPSSGPDPELQFSSSPTAAPIPSPALDARFEVVGSPFSLLSVTLAASQNLFTRRGTLVGFSGKVENTVSTLSFLEPFRRAPAGIPFLYQKLTSTSPITALISTKGPISSIVTVELDGRQDWLISQRQALLAWTGHTLHLRPQYNIKLGLANWGNTFVTGRGLLALTGSGQIYQVQLKAGESYVAHPSNVVAYSASATPPLPFRFRFKSSALRFQVPDLGFGSLLQNIKFFNVMSQTATWRALARASHTAKIWLQRTIWGDRLFLQFEGPTTMLIQSRASRISDVLTLKDAEEIAESPPGAVQDAVTKKIREEIKEIAAHPPSGQIASQPTPESTTMHYATIRNGKAEFRDP
ncbi:hypothetical protein P154DRAFT_418695 [Amniculicola lignicola CBS 123094]|uniref:Altered inheritance of mitochondria protein 24, mitochondrial n=1 Tax=Amniculicola lignicola CBS 123094 TaxID=1392246 RepID=A0A6A5X470_9PLEO|nr:hypothetical protein P154DRAFT_418695 [Amniculicola lignicola CBS 123094]